MELTKEDLLVLTNPVLAGIVLAAAILTLAVLAIALPVLVVCAVGRKHVRLVASCPTQPEADVFSSATKS